MSDFEQETKLHGAFAAFRAESMHDVSPAGTDAVRSTVRHQRKVRNIALGVLALTVMAVPVAAYATLQGDPHGPPPGVPGTTAPVTAEPTPVPSPSASLDQKAPDLPNARIAVPGWPGGENITKFCAAGTYTFANGKVVFGQHEGYESTYSQDTEYPLVRADLDGQPGDEILMHLTCSGPGSFHPQQLLALKPLPDGTVRTLGWVIAPKPGEIYAYREVSVKVADRVVSVEVMGAYRTNGWYTRKQTRSYRYEGTAFKQVAGPTSFPVVPSTLRGLDLRQQPVQVTDFGCTGCRLAIVNFVDGRGSDTVQTAFMTDPTRVAVYEFTIEGFVIAGPQGGEHALALVTSRAPDGATQKRVYDVRVGTTGPGDEFGVILENPVAATGKGGVTDIVGIKAGPRESTVEVTVRTAAGQEARIYQWGVTGSQSWSHEPS
ncbi:hypothetical protein AB0M43_30240 [Longispora sp. NPDC051575]|uniref:hypothetical protein n=1 Tax=Longispora sp. NPDC051575 TaxID=3154943 RepID=UPI00343520D5